MKEKLFTIAGTEYYYGMSIFEKGTKVKLIKEPGNKYDSEAIRVELKGHGKVGYVGNSTHTVIGESMSAGRLYDHMGKKAKGKVISITPRGVICKLKED